MFDMHYVAWLTLSSKYYKHAACFIVLISFSPLREDGPTGLSSGVGEAPPAPKTHMKGIKQQVR